MLLQTNCYINISVVYMQLPKNLLAHAADEIQPHRENTYTPNLTNIMITQKELEEKINKLKKRKLPGPDGVSARLLKFAAKSIAPSSKRILEHSAKACTPLPLDQWKTARVSAAFKKGERVI